MNATTMKFRRTVDSILSPTDEKPFPLSLPLGQLNTTAWMGKPPRSCMVTGLHQDAPVSKGESAVFEIEVTFKPKGYISHVNDTMYDGWTAKMVDAKKDGTLLDGSGNPLPEGEPPVLLSFEVYHDSEFNNVDFGEFVGEFDLETGESIGVTGNS